MNKILNLLAITLMFIIINLSNAQTTDWANGNEALVYNQGPKLVKTDSRGNVYNIGRFLKKVDFDPGAGVFNLSTTNSAFNGFITKTNKAGTFLWAKKMSCIFDSDANSIEIDENDNIYITGSFHDTIDLDPGIGVMKVKGYFDFYVIKLDTGGNLIWGKTSSGFGNSTSTGIALDAKGAVYTVGKCINGSDDLNPGSGVANVLGAAFILKLDNNGNFIWAKTLKSTGNIDILSICTDRFSNICMTGGYIGTVDFDPNAGTADLSCISGNDIFVCKLDSSGRYKWARSLGGNNTEYGLSIAADDLGSTIICGQFFGTIDFDPGTGTDIHTSQGLNNDMYVLKLDSAGKYKWVYIADGKNGGEVGSSIALDFSGNIYVAGGYTDSTDFDPGAGKTLKINVGADDAFAMKLNSNGQFIWVQSYGSSSFDAARSIFVDKLRNVYLVGLFSGNINFGLSKTYTTANQGYFWLKISQCNIAKTLNASACRQYVLNNKMYTQGGSYNFLVAGTGNCDTLYTLNLSINKSLPIVSAKGNAITTNITGASYKWLNCTNGKQVINGQTAQDYTPVASGSYAVVVTKNNCTDTSACFNFNLSGINQIASDKISIYPNPSEGWITIKNLTGNEIITVMNPIGQTIINDISVNGETLDLRGLDNGIYYIEIVSDNKSQIIKFIKI
jgi:hypothetical protein